MQITKSFSKSKQTINFDQTRSYVFANAQWLENYRQSINRTLEQIEQNFNRLVDRNRIVLSIDEQVQSMQELIGRIKTIQIICSDIQSSFVLNKINQLKAFANQLSMQSKNNENNQNIVLQKTTQVLCDLLLALIKYIQTYCQAFLIPYEVEVYTEENKIIDIKQIQDLVKRIKKSSCQILNFSSS